MKNIILNLPFKKLTSLFTALVFFCNIIAPLPAMAQKNQPKKKLTLEQKIASIKENVTVDGIEKFKSEVERLLEDGKGVLSPEECWEAKPQTIEQYVSKCLYGGAFSEDDEIIKIKSQKLYAYQKMQKIHQNFNGTLMNFIVNPYEGGDDRDMLWASLADILPEYYQDETAIEAAVVELTNYLKKQVEFYQTNLQKKQSPQHLYSQIPLAYYPFPSAKSTIENSPYFSQKGKLSKFFHYTMISDMLTSPACDEIFDNEKNRYDEKNSYVAFFRHCNTSAHKIPTFQGKYKAYKESLIEDSSRDWIVSHPISQMILANYLKESFSSFEDTALLEYYMLLGFANMLGSQVSYIHSERVEDLDVADEKDIGVYYWSCQYALDKFEEYKKHLEQGNNKAGFAALEDIAKTSGLKCFSDWWRQDGDIEKWEKDYLNLLVHYMYGMKHNQVRRIIDITTANAYLLMKALIYVDKNYGSNLTSDQPIPSEMQGIIEPILQKITGKYLTWKDFEKVFRGNTLTTENINEEGAARNYTFKEKVNDMSGLFPKRDARFSLPIIDLKAYRKGLEGLGGMLDYLDAVYLVKETSKTDEDYAEEAAEEFFSARTTTFVSRLLNLHKPVVASIHPRLSIQNPIYLWLDINTSSLCNIGVEYDRNEDAVKTKSCAPVDRAILEFQGAKGVYNEKTGKFEDSTYWDRKKVEEGLNVWENLEEAGIAYVVEAVVGYVTGLAFIKLINFVKARKAANAAKAAAKVNSSTGNVVNVPNKSYVPKNKSTGKGGSRARSGGNRNGNSTLRDKRNNARNRQKATGGNPTPSIKKPYVRPSVKRGVEHIKGDWYKVNFGDGNSIRVKLKEGQKIELLDDGSVVIKDLDGDLVDNFPNLSEFKKHFTQAADGSWVFSQASVDAQGGFGKLLKENGHLFGDPKNYKELGEVVANDQSNFRRLFKDNESAKLANELVGNGQYEELGNLVDDAVTPFRYKSPASGMADDIRYLSMKLEKTPDGIKGSSVVEIPLGEISQWDKASDFLKSNTQSYELMDEFELSDYNIKQIKDATPNQNGKYQIKLKNTNGKIPNNKPIGQLEYNQLKQLAEGKGGRFVMLKKNTWDEMCEVAKKLDDEIITPHLKQRSGVSGWDSEATYIRGGSHEYGPGGKTDYVFLKVEDGTQHIHIEKKINFELNGKTYTTIYNVNVPIKIESKVMQEIFENTPNGIGLLQLIFLSGVSVAGMGEASDELYQEP